jgi:protoporphyrinogen oxidase
VKSGRILSSMIGAGLSKKDQAPNYYEWVRRRFGSEITEMVFRPLIEKIWGTPLEDLSARFAWQRIAISSLWEIAWEMIRGKRKADFSSPYYPQNHFLYPRRGFGAIVDSMTGRIRGRGGKILLESQVRQIKLENGRAAGVEVQTPQGPLGLGADWVVSTLPVSLLPAAIGPAPQNPAWARAARSLRFRSLSLLFLARKRGNPGRFSPWKSHAGGRRRPGGSRIPASSRGPWPRSRLAGSCAGRKSKTTSPCV